MLTVRRSTVLIVLILAGLAAGDAPAQTFCTKPKPVPQPPPPAPYPPVCEPKKCDRCAKSPCYLATGMYVDDFLDLQVPTAGTFPLIMTRRYESDRPADGPLGIGWSSSLTSRLYYATYLKAAPSTYSYEADIVMPDGVLYRFTISSAGAFVPPFGRYDTLVRNADGTYVLTLQRSRTVYRFNADGSIASLTDDYGNQVTYSYDAAGRVQQVADAAGSGRSLNVTYGADGRIASVADHTGRTLKYFYGTNGTMTSFSDPIVSDDSSQRSAYYSYVSSRFGLVLSNIEDRWHRSITQLEWYPDGKLKSYTEGRYDAANPSTSEGEKYTYTYGAAAPPYAGSVIKIHSLGSKTYNYLPSGLVNDLATYDSSGMVTSESTPTGTRTFEYTGSDFKIFKVTDAAATRWYSYDTSFPEKVASIVPRDANGGLLNNWAAWAYDYNPPGSTAAGALAHVYRIRTDHSTRDVVATYVYDAKGHVTNVTDDNLLQTAYTYNAAGDLTSVTRGIYTTSYGYDSLGRQTSMTTPDGQQTTYAYDAADRLTSVTLPKPAAGSPLVFATTFSYDNFDSGSGLVFTNVTDPNGRLTRNGFDVSGHVAQTVDALGAVTSFGYQYGLLAKITDANGNITSYSYSPNRDLARTTFPDGAFETYEISNGVLFARTDRSSRRLVYTYDGLGRLLRAEYNGLTGPAGFVGQVYTYDGQNLYSITDATTTAVSSFAYEYDSSWRRITETLAGADKTTFAYVTGPSTSTTWAGSLLSSYKIEPAFGSSGTTQTVSYQYDPLGRVGTINWNWIGAPLGIEYQPNGQYARISFPNGQNRYYSYDNQGRLTNISNKDGAGNVLAAFDYAYDFDWNSNSYAMLGQRTSMTVSGSAGLPPGMTKYRYDALYQLTRADYPSGTNDTWTYDAIGNRTSWRGTHFLDYTYYKNGANPNNGQRLRNDGQGPYDFTYDANGNLTKESHGLTFTWDYAGRLTSFMGSATTAYDYLGRRQSVTASGSTIRYISFGLHTVGERNTTTGVSTDYLFGPGIDEPLAKRTASGSISYYGADGLGSVVLVTDSAGIPTSTMSYSPWGETGSAPELFGYTGRETSTAGPWFYRARYYDANRGRFLSEDPEGVPQVSAYGYARNSPARLSDPLGLEPVPSGNGVIPCIARQGQLYLAAVKACHIAYLVTPGTASAQLYVCMSTRKPWDRAICVKEYERDLREAKEELAQCLASNFTTYRWNIYVCCQGLPDDATDRYH